MIESDIAQVSATREKPGLVEINKVIGPIFTFGLRGRHVFSTVHEYQRLLRDRTLRDVIRASLAARKSYSEEQIRQAPYFALFRADKYTEKPKAKGAGGWYKNWDIQKSIPVLVIPNIGGADLDKLIEIEKAALAE
jgi:hypothetical protein